VFFQASNVHFTDVYLFIRSSGFLVVDFLTEIKRRPLPPQTHTFMTSSATGPVYRDPPPHSIANPPGRDMDTRGRLLDSSNPPRRPRRGSISPSRAENRGGIPRQHDAGRSSNLHPHVPPGVETHMDVDPEHLERSSYIPSPSIPRGSRPQVEERFELPEGPRSSRPPPPKPTVPMDFHPGFPQGPNSSDYTNFGPQSRPVPSAYGTSRYDQKRTDGYPDRDQGQSERRPAMAHGDRGGPPVSVRFIIYSPQILTLFLSHGETFELGQKA
jgi:hypothetical protein